MIIRKVVIAMNSEELVMKPIKEEEMKAEIYEEEI